MDNITLWPEKVSNSKARVVKELVQGQEFAAKLRTLIKKPYVEEDGSFPFSSSSCHEILSKILRSFNESLAILTSLECADGDQQLLCQNLASSQVESACYDDRRCEDSGESKKRPTTAKDRRGCYKRKKNLQTWTIVSSKTEDGQAWRKYGQKEILNSKQPRSYFRCTRKYDQGCRATKQVQRMEDDPQKYNITYIGHHTCKDIILNPAPQILITDSSSEHPNWGSCNFKVNCSDSKNIRREGDQQCHQFTITTSSFATPIITTLVKQETKEQDQHHHHHHMTPTSDVTGNVSSLDCGDIWKNLMTPAFDDESIMSLYSCSTTTEANSQSFGMDFQDCNFLFNESEISFE